MIRILLIEDDAETRECMKMLLRGMEVDEATTITEGMDHCRNDPDIILLDASLPDAPAHFGESVKAIREHTTKPVIVVTGHPWEGVGEEMIASGASDFVSKDNLKELPGRILVHLERAKYKAELLEAIRQEMENDE